MSRSLGLLWRAVRAALVFVVALVALYLIVGNGLLLARVPVGYLETSSSAIRIGYSSAWTWWPGHIRARDLVVSVQEHGEEMEFRAAAATARVVVGDLMRRTFHATELEVEELTFRYRSRRDTLEQAQADAAMLPPIGPWGAFALKDGKPKEPPPSDASYDRWQVVLENTSATVREVWVEGVRITGPAVVAGGMHFKPYRYLRIAPSNGHGRGARIERMGLPDPDLITDLDLTVRFTVQEFPLDLDALELLRFADADLSGHGFAQLGAWLTATGALPGPGATAVDGTGPLWVHLATRQGKFLPGSRASWETVHLDLTTAQGRALVQGPASVHAVARPGDVVAVAVDTSAVQMRFLELAGGVARAEGLSGRLRLVTQPHFLAPTFEGARVSLPAANLGLPGLRLGPGVRFERGIAFGRAKVTIDRDLRMQGEGATRVEDLVMVAAGKRFAGKMSSDLKLEEATFGDHVRMRATSFVRLEDVAIVSGDERVDGWWGRIEASSSIEKIGEGPVSSQTRLHGRYRDAEPARVLLEGEGYIPGVVGGQLTMKGLVATGMLESRGPRLQIDLEDAVGEGARVRGRTVKSGEQMRAAFLVETPLVAVGVAVAAKKTSIQLEAGDGWLAEQTGFLGTWTRSPASAAGKGKSPIR